MLFSENGLWGQSCHRHAGVWFEREDALQPVCEPAHFVIEGESDLSALSSVEKAVPLGLCVSSSWASWLVS